MKYRWDLWIYLCILANKNLTFKNVLSMFSIFLFINSISLFNFKGYVCYLARNGAAVNDSLVSNLEFGGFAVEVLLNHQRYLEGNCVVELTKVKTGELSDLLKTVNESVSMYEELSRGLRNVKVVFEEALYGHESLAVE